MSGNTDPETFKNALGFMGVEYGMEPDKYSDLFDDYYSPMTQVYTVNIGGRDIIEIPGITPAYVEYIGFAVQGVFNKFIAESFKAWLDEKGIDFL
jgi:hypothetical protein